MLPLLLFYLPVILSDASGAGAGNEWLPVIISFVTAVLTVGTSFYVSRGKQKTTDFEVIIDERKEFTEEIRKELKRKQQEYEAELAERDVLIRKLRESLVIKEETIFRLRTKIEENGLVNTAADSESLTQE